MIRERDLLHESVTISARILNNEEAIGNPSRQDYPLLKGKEFLMEAVFRGARGQAFTDAPCEKVSTLAEIAALSLDRVEHRALFVAALNAVIRFLKPESGTIHCHDDEPEDCAGEIVRRLQQGTYRKIGLVGLQPAILDALVKGFGKDNVRCVDRDESQKGGTRFGVQIRWGDEKETQDLFRHSDIILSTGSTIVNGSLPGLLELAGQQRKEIVFYGTSIAGAAELMSLKRFCFAAA